MRPQFCFILEKYRGAGGILFWPNGKWGEAEMCFFRSTNNMRGAGVPGAGGA